LRTYVAASCRTVPMTYTHGMHARCTSSGDYPEGSNQAEPATGLSEQMVRPCIFSLLPPGCKPRTQVTCCIVPSGLLCTQAPVHACGTAGSTHFGIQLMRQEIPLKSHELTQEKQPGQTCQIIECFCNVKLSFLGCPFLQRYI
jgi:hypothetical protein